MTATEKNALDREIERSLGGGRPGLSPAQACQLASLAAEGRKITTVSVHPFSGAAIVYCDRETVAIYAPDGATTYRGRA